MQSDTRHALALTALAACATALISAPVLLVPPSTIIAIAVVAGIAVVVGSVVLLVTRDLTRGPNWHVRLYRSGLVAVVLSFVVTATLTPPDPLTQLVYGAPALGVALLVAHVAVAYDVDRSIVARVR